MPEAEVRSRLHSAEEGAPWLKAVVAIVQKFIPVVNNLEKAAQELHRMHASRDSRDSDVE